MHTIIIPVAGAGSRVKAVLDEKLPKNLLQYNAANTVVEQTIQNIATATNDLLTKTKVIFVVCSISHKQMIEQQLALNVGSTLKLNNVDVSYSIHPEFDGSLNAVKTAIIEHNVTNAFWAVWCDLVPDVSSFVSMFNRDIKPTSIQPIEQNAIGTCGNSSRWQFDMSGLEPHPQANGNVIGIYRVGEKYVEKLVNMSTYRLHNPNPDLIEFFVNIGHYHEIRLIVDDLGDEAKVAFNNEKQSHNSLGRWFNDIEIKDSKLIKQGNCDFGDVAISEEISYYDFAKSIGIESKFPELYSKQKDRKLVIHYLGDGWMTLTDAVKRFDSLHLFNAVINEVNNLHKTKFESTNNNERMGNMLFEYVGKTRIRQNSYSSVIKHTLEANKYLNKFQQYFSEMDSFLVAVTHGDLNTNNVMIKVNTNGVEVKFIDPRYRFGKDISAIGDPRQDFAKLVYSQVFFAEIDQMHGKPNQQTLDSGLTPDDVFHNAIDMICDLELDKMPGGIKYMMTVIACAALSLPPFLKQDPTLAKLSQKFAIHFAKQTVSTYYTRRPK